MRAQSSALRVLHADSTEYIVLLSTCRIMPGKGRAYPKRGDNHDSCSFAITSAARRYANATIDQPLASSHGHPRQLTGNARSGSMLSFSSGPLPPISPHLFVDQSHAPFARLRAWAMHLLCAYPILQTVRVRTHLKVVLPKLKIFHSSMLVFAAEERGRGGHCVVFIADPDSAFGSEKDQA